MSLRSINAHAFRVAQLVLVLSVAFVAAQAQQPGPFASLAGNWSGVGSIAMSNGAKERIRCRAIYKVDGSGSKVDLQLRCASDSYKFELQGNVVYQNGEVAGVWNESTRRAAGNMTGSVNGNRIDVRAAGQTFTALLSLTTRGDKQSISIQSPGSEMLEAVVALNRG